MMADLSDLAPVPHHLPASQPRYSAADVIAALQRSRGMISPAARALKCSAETIRNYARRHASVAAAIAEQREQTTDVAELALYRAIEAGESWAVRYYLSTQGKDRGYIERQQQEHSGDVTIRVLYEHSDPHPAAPLPGAGGD